MCILEYMFQFQPRGRTLATTGAQAGMILDAVHRFTGSRQARLLVLALFTIEAVTLACITHIGIPPDETTHKLFIEYYANHSLSPFLHHQTPTYNLGDKTREVDYIYHYTMSLVYRLLPLAAGGKYIVIRLFSVVAGLGSFLLLARILKRLGISAGVITFSLLVLANVPMVLMMSSAINNDVFVWLGMLLGIWLLIRLWQKPTATDLVWLFALSLAGGLVKRTFLPLGCVFILLAIILALKRRSAITRGLWPMRWQFIAACCVLLVFSGLFLERVGGNVLLYHAVTPTCEQVDGVAACKVFWANIRAQTFPPALPVSPTYLPVFSVRWLFESLQNVLDIQTQFWLHQVQPTIWMSRLLSSIFIAGVGYGIFYDWRGRGAQDKRHIYRLFVVCVCLGFIGVHLFINFQSYQEHKVFGLALNGRYIIPSLLPLVGLSAFYWSKLLASHQRLLVSLALATILLMGFGSGLQLMVRNPQLYKGCSINPSLPADCN